MFLYISLCSSFFEPILNIMSTTEKKPRSVRYPRSMKLFDKDKNQIAYAITQLYKIGVYMALYDGKGSILNQYNFTPGQAKKFMAQFKEENLKDGAYAEFNTDITVTQEDGFYVERELV